MEDLPIGVWIIDHHGETLFANRKMIEILEAKSQKDVSRSIYSILTPQSKNQLKTLIEKLPELENDFIEVDLITCTDKQISILLTCVIASEDSQFGSSIFLTCTKISPFKVSYRQLEKESERRLEEAQQVAKIGSWSYNLINNKFVWSRQMFRLFPIFTSDVPPTLKEFIAAIYKEDQSLWQEAFHRCAHHGFPYKLRVRTVVSKKTIWIKALGYTEVNMNGEVIGLSGTCQDISELINAEESTKLERIKAMQNAKMASLGEMSAGIAHEINNPLAIISGNIYLLPRFLDDPKKLNDKIGSIQRATERIGKIVSGLRKFSRSSIRSERGIYFLRSIILESVGLTAAKASRHSTEVMVECPEDIHILCDEIEIEQVLINLVNNAIDAVKDLPERWVKIQCAINESKILLKVIDSGHGIPEYVAEKLFQPFFTTKNVGEGTGLGLSIIKGILDEHEATIELGESQSHTSFEINFKKPMTAIPSIE